MSRGWTASGSVISGDKGALGADKKHPVNESVACCSGHDLGHKIRRMMILSRSGMAIWPMLFGRTLLFAFILIRSSVGCVFSYTVGEKPAEMMIIIMTRQRMTNSALF
ncbi:hypothetical protein L228DRAFT_142797 [Xylona heveae TC161]|uniref:Uncharacterized protein n=1 Tax=Xylona heveae (strain CBS 132557 / TC161) TaxID=1328760 RepID=A0A165H741_XYLHT|nr:hypothetical protein L228DRAFT_142797 [Xylona heveae TC161]KZF23078.1 hypothetical protein L228DRAFT_142797 [Xylona heveae TC161]